MTEIRRAWEMEHRVINGDPHGNLTVQELIRALAAESERSERPLDWTTVRIENYFEREYMSEGYRVVVKEKDGDGMMRLEGDV